MIRLRLALGFALFVCTSLSAAQQTTTLRGTVRDAFGAPIQGVALDVVVADRVVTTVTTGADGRYEALIAASVPFTVVARFPGFADEAIDVEGGDEPITKDFRLQVGRFSDRLSVTASRGPESLTRVTQSVTIATDEDIHALGSSSLADVIRFVPGVAVEGNGRESGPTSVFSRGGESDYNLVLIDGVRVNQNGGFFDFGRITANDIDRVEVVRGAQSSLWGSDAMGSVIQVFTKRAAATDFPRVTGSIEGGTFKTFRGDVHVLGGVKGRGDYAVGVSRRQTDGAFAELLPEDDRFEQSGFDTTAGAALGSRATIRGGFRYTRAEAKAVGPITFGSRDTGTASDTKDLSWHVAVAHAAGVRFTGTATVNGFRYESRNEDLIADAPFSTYAILEGTPDALFPNGMRLVRLISESDFSQLSAAGAMPGANQYLASATSFDFVPPGGFRSTGELRRPGFRYQGDLTWANGYRLTGGWDWEREIRPAQTEPAALPRLTVDNNGFFLQQQLSFADRWFVTVGARADRKETLDTFFSPKLSAGGFALPPRRGALSSIKVFGNIGKGIKSPLFSERYGASFADPNPDLKVERARTADVGVEMTLVNERFRASATYFNNDYTDQIAFRFGSVGDGVPEFINIDGSRADGWELDLALQRRFAGVTAMATYARVDTEVVTNLSTSQQFQPGQPLLRRPKHSGTVRVGYMRDRLSANFDARWVGDRHDNSFLFMRTVPNATRPAFFTDITLNPGYAVAGFSVDYQLDRAASVFLRVNNVGDTEYDGALGYPGTPRSAMVGVRFNIARR